MNVHARLTVSAKIPQPDGSATIHFAAVYSNDPNHPNKAFTDATPSAYMQMHIAAGKPAIDAFQQGQEFDVLFSPVPKSA